MPNKTQFGASGTSRPLPITLKASGAETGNTTGGAVDFSDVEVACIQVVVTAASGTPTMTVVIEGSYDGGANWFTLGTFGANGFAPGAVATAPSNITGTTTQRGCVATPPLVRYRSVIGGGTPSLTYSVTAG